MDPWGRHASELALHCIKIQLSVSFVEIIMVADLYSELPAWESLIMASQKAVIAISRICIIGLGLLDVFLIGTTTKQNKN